jgi:hypothetical protein
LVNTGYNTETNPLDEGTVLNNDDNPGENDLPEPPVTGQSDEVWYSVAVRPPFLRQRDILPANLNSIIPATVNVPVFKRLNLRIPSLAEISTEGFPTRDVVRTCAATPGKGLRKGAPEIFDTVFARKDSLMGDRLKWWSSKGTFAHSMAHRY